MGWARFERKLRVNDGLGVGRAVGELLPTACRSLGELRDAPGAARRKSESTRSTDVGWHQIHVEFDYAIIVVMAHGTFQPMCFSFQS